MKNEKLSLLRKENNPMKNPEVCKKQGETRKRLFREGKLQPSGVAKIGENYSTINGSWNRGTNFSGMLGKHHSEETKEKMRISAIDYIKNKNENFSPRVGKDEKQILDELQNKIGFSIKRQFFVNGYFLDGYCQELNLAIEIDEEHHYKNSILNPRDLEKQNNIMKILGCNFIRLKVSEVIVNEEIKIEVKI